MSDEAILEEVEDTSPPPPKFARFLATVLGSHYFKIAVSLAIVAAALLFLHDASKEIAPGALWNDLTSVSMRTMALAIGCVALSFLAYSTLDVIILSSMAPGMVPRRVAAATGATAAAVANLLGFSYLTATTVRYRVYSRFGVDAPKIAGLFAYTWSGYTIGVSILIGIMLIIRPDSFATLLPFNPDYRIVIGVVLLLLVAVLLLSLGRLRERGVRIFGHDIAVPTRKQALSLAAIGMMDLTAASLTLYVLFPAEFSPEFGTFLAYFMLSLALGLISHSPGGLGVFEATILATTGATGSSQALAALLLYRAVYTLLPFLVALVAVAIFELRERRGALSAASQVGTALLRPLIPVFATGIALIAGGMLLLSGNLPRLGPQTKALESIFPLGLVEVSHLLGSVIGVLLLVVARGLYRRLKSAWTVTMGLLILGAITAVIKGFDLIEAALILIAALILWSFRSSFHRDSGAGLFRLDWRWAIGATALFASLTWIGFFAYRHVAYQDALWWQFAWNGDASRFLRASLVGAVVLAALGAHSLIGGRRRTHFPEPIPDAVRDLLPLAKDAEANFALLGDKSFLVDPENRAFLSFADTGNALVSKSDPVGDHEAAEALLWRFRELADREGKRAVFYAVSDQFMPSFVDMGMSVIKYGEVAEVDLKGFSLEGPKKKHLRYSKSKAARDGLEFRIIEKAEIAQYLPELRGISDRWLAMHNGREKSFALGAFVDEFLLNFDFATMVDTNTGKIVAFANLIYAGQEEIAIDLMRHEPDAPSVTMEAFFVELMLWAQAQNIGRFSMGAAPFSGAPTHELASVWQRLGGFIYNHGGKLYHFQGLRRFKEKFGPEWRPNYIVCSGGITVIQAAMDVNKLVSGGVSGLLEKNNS